MRIGIDISQIVYEGTGVARYVEEMVRNLVQRAPENEYILMGISFRQGHKFEKFKQSISTSSQVRLVNIVFPIRIFEFLWNILHIFPIEWFIGPIDIFWSSDWVQPPMMKAFGVTTIHDLSIFRFPESFSQEIVTVHKRKLRRSSQKCGAFFCDSIATKEDAMKFLGISENKLHVIYPGYSL